MDTSQMKNIVVLKNIPSNIVEEAIVVLKSNKKAKQLKQIEKQNSGERIEKKDRTREYIVKEAEMVIANYISNIETRKNINSRNMKSITQKYKRLRILTTILSIIILFYIIANII